MAASVIDPRRARLVLELAADLAEQMHVPTIAEYVLDAGVAVIGATAASVCLLASAEEFEIVGQRGLPRRVVEGMSRFARDAPLPVADSVRDRTPVFLRSADEVATRYPMLATLAGEHGATAVLPMVVRDSALGALSFTFDAAREFSDEERTFLTILARHCAAAIDRAQVHAAALRREEHLALVAEASSVLAEHGDDLVGALQAVARRLVPVLSDMCAIFLVEGVTSGRLVAWAKSDPAVRTSAAGVGEEYELDGTKSHRLNPAIESRSVVVWDDGESFLDQIGAPDSLRRAMSDLGIGPGTLVPLVARGRAVGMLALANRTGRRPLPDEAALANTLGQRMAVLIDNATLLVQRTEISKGLQAALLPPALPVVEGLQVAARYRAAGAGLDVGGDFYDVVARDSGRWLLVVGDVTGHGVRAAATTGLLRHTIASAARLGSSLPQILVHANEALIARGDDTGTFATLAMVDVDVRPGDASSDDVGSGNGSPWGLHVVCGGHPPPLLLRADGRVEELRAHGRLLGFFAALAAHDVHAQLEPGDAVVMYTDGVTERHDDRTWFGLSELRTLVASCVGCSADDIAARIEHTVVDGFDGPPADDIAVLVLRRE